METEWWASEDAGKAYRRGWAVAAVQLGMDPAEAVKEAEEAWERRRWALEQLDKLERGEA